MAIPAVFDYHINGFTIEIFDCFTVGIGKLIKWVMLLLIFPIIISTIIYIPISSLLILNTGASIIFVFIAVFWMILLTSKLFDFYTKIKTVFYYRRNACKVDEKSYPELYKLINLAATRLSLKKIPDVYIVQNPIMNAFSVGNGAFILMFSSTLDVLNDAEVLYLIGHEFSHIKMLDTPDSTFKAVLLEILHLRITLLRGHFSVWLRKFFNIVYTFTNRWYIEYLADLGGYEANQNLAACITALAKIGGGKQIGENMLKNGFAYPSYLDKTYSAKKTKRYIEIITYLLINQLYKVLFSHPPAPDRILVLKKYVEYQNMIKGNVITVVPLNKNS
jgi:Zn-dependent protease with chaperone function